MTTDPKAALQQAIHIAEAIAYRLHTADHDEHGKMKASGAFLVLEALRETAAQVEAATCRAQYHPDLEHTKRLCIRAALHTRTGTLHTDEHGFDWSDSIAVYPTADPNIFIPTQQDA